MGDYVLHLGDCLDVMPDMEPNSIHSIVTDPPYGLTEPRNRSRIRGDRKTAHW